ncbi:MAG: murein biosynthesis integral membrane protein MurJ [Pseudomonadota bacterium]
MPNDPDTSIDKPKTLVRSGLLFSALTFVSRILGFVRDQVFAIVFGAGAMTDAFVVAFKIPNFFRRLFGEGAFAQAFVPVFTEYKEKRDFAALRDLAVHVSGTLGGVLLLITTLGVAGAPLVVMLFAPGFVDDAERFDMATDMLRWTFPYLLFISLVAYAGGILNSHGKFGIPAFTPVLLNICLIAAALGFADQADPPIMAMAIGVFVAGVVQLGFQLPFLAQLNLLPMPRWDWAHEGVRKIFKLMLPALFGSSVAQISILLDTILASFLITGSMTWLYLSDRLVEFPVGIFGVALGTVILPRLSQLHAQENPQQFNRTLDIGLRLGVLIGLPSTLGLVLLAEPVILTLFGYGAFTANDAKMASLSLSAYALAITPFILIKVLAPGFYSRQDTTTPMKIGVTALSIKMVLSLAIVIPMVQMEFHAPHVGLAVATAIFAWVHMAMLLHGLRKRSIYNPQAGWLKYIVVALLGVACLGAAVIAINPAMDFWISASFWTRGLWTLMLVALACLVYAAVLLICGLRPRQFRQ